MKNVAPLGPFFMSGDDGTQANLNVFRVDREGSIRGACVARSDTPQDHHLEGRNASADAAKIGRHYAGPMRVGTLSGEGGDVGDALGEAGADMPGAP
jgi:hypothetical protein